MSTNPRFMSRDEKMSLQESQLKDLQEQQIEEVLGHRATEFVEANRDPKFKIRKIESESYVHVWTRVKHLDSGGKSVTNEDRVIMFHAYNFDRYAESGAFATYDELKVVHDPRKNAPTAYNLQPSQVNIPGTGATTPGLSHIKTSELQLELEKKDKKLSRMLDDAENRLAEIDKRQKEQDAADILRAKQLVEKDNEIAELRRQILSQPNNTPAPEFTAGPVNDAGNTTGPVTV